MNFEQKTRQHIIAPIFNYATASYYTRAHESAVERYNQETECAYDDLLPVPNRRWARFLLMLLNPRIKKVARIAASTAAAFCMVSWAPGGMAKPAPLSPAAERSSRPLNIVFVLVDDLRFDGMGFLQPGLKTPNIDRLARGGTYFPNAVVTSSLCSPSRASILTGESVSNHGVVDNNNSSEAGLTYFPSYLQQAGYQTALIGKWHMGMSSDAPRPGFNKWVSFLGQGTYFPTKGTMLNVDGKHVPQKGYITDELTDYALHWLDAERDKSKPFFLYLSHKGVHSDTGSAIPPTRYAHQYDGQDFKLPSSIADTPENYRSKPMWVRNQRNSWHGVDFPYNTRTPMQVFLRNYYATLSGVDDSVGRIVDYLRKNHLEKDTMIVFTSDNGFLIGDHGLIDKRNAYEPSVRVPLVISAPGLVPAGKTNSARIRNIDFAPTFLDVAGVPAPSQFEGRSALPVISGKMKVADWKPGDFIYEYYWEWNFPMTPTTFAIERDRLKYIQYHGVYDLEELYDLDKDPDEMTNLIDDPTYGERRSQLRRALYQGLADRQGRHSVPFSARQSPGFVKRAREGSGAASFPDSWLTDK